MPAKITLKDLPKGVRESLGLRLKPAATHGIEHPPVVILDFRPTRMNVLLKMHHYQYNRTKRDEETIIALACHQAGLTGAIGKRRVRYNFTLCGRQRKGDPDAYAKILLDALTKCGALIDDNSEWCEPMAPTFDRGKRGCTTIYLEDIP